MRGREVLLVEEEEVVVLRGGLLVERVESEVLI